MTIEYLKILNFRNLTEAELTPAKTGFNFICGDNGSGKTSLLEAIYYLGLGRSFRTSSTSNVIFSEADNFLLSAQINVDENIFPVGIERSRTESMRIRINGKDAKSVAELAQFLPVRVMNSSCYQLLEGGPSFRRDYIDWGLFYHSENFLAFWRQFNRALKQRNLALQNHCSKDEIEAWTKELINASIQIDILRGEYVADLLPFLQKMLNSLLPNTFAEVSYYCGWNNAMSYASVLASSLQQDMRTGHTQQGPHRADLRLNINQVAVKDVLSRGQQKLFVCAMIMAQGALLISHKKRKLVYLIDDLPSELDSLSRANLIKLLCQQNAQVFVTAIEPERAKDFATEPEKAVNMFHVKHGVVTSRVRPEEDMVFGDKSVV